MRLNFRQGIARHQTDAFNTPLFLSVSGGYVSLIASPDPTIVAFAHGTKDYLYTERQTVPNAWGPFTPGTDFYLYWQLNPVTGQREFGYTTKEPIETASAPTSPSMGQMWFNTSSTTFFEWNGSSWIEVIRVFACRLENGLTPRSMSINAPAFTGTQVGLTGARRIGSIAYDQEGKPIRTGDRKFFTTEDVFVTGIPSGASVRVNNILLPGIAQEPLAAYSVVEYNDFNGLVAASPYTQGTKVYGFTEEDAPTGAVVNFVLEGMITNSDWDWVDAGADVNDPVYNDGTGLITLTPAIPNQLPVGVVTGRHEILFTPRLFPQVNATIDIPQTFLELEDTPADYTGAAGQFVKINATEDGLEYDTALQSVVWGDITGLLINQTDLNAALNNKVSRVSTTVMAAGVDLVFSGGQIRGLPAIPSEDSAATSKEYVDSLVTGLIWRDPIIDPEIVHINANTPPVTPSLHETFILGATPSGDWSAFSPGTPVHWTGSTWVESLNRPVQTGDRFGVSMEPLVYPSPNLDVSVVSAEGKIITIDTDTPGSVTFTSYTPVTNDAVFVNNDLSSHFGHSYTFLGEYGTGSYGTEYKWIEFMAPTVVEAGDFLAYTGNTLNVTEDFTRIIDGDGDTYLRVESGPAVDDDHVVARIGAISPEYVSRDVIDFSADGFYIDTLSAFIGSDNDGVSLDISTGDGDTSGAGGNIGITAGNGGTDGDGGSIDLAAGNAGATGIAGGSLQLSAGNGSSTGGNIYLAPGNGTTPGYVLVEHPAAGKPAELRIEEGAATGYVGFKGPADVSTGSTGNGANTVWTLPEGDGTDGQALVTNGAGVLRWESAGGGSLPAGADCEVLSYKAGSWQATAPLLMPTPYDISMHVEGATPDSTKVLRFMATRHFNIFDYGHQADGSTGGPLSGFDEFIIRRNGSQFASVRFSQSHPYPIFVFNTGFQPIQAGDIIEITSPALPDATLTDVALTLRGYENPPVSCTEISIAFPQSEYVINSLIPQSLSFLGGDVTINGTWTHAEWSIVQVSVDNGYTWEPYDDGFSAGNGTGDNVNISFGTPKLLRTSSDYQISNVTDPSFQSTFPSTTWFKLRLTVFGPAAVSTADVVLRNTSF